MGNVDFGADDKVYPVAVQKQFGQTHGGIVLVFIDTLF